MREGRAIHLALVLLPRELGGCRGVAGTNDDGLLTCRHVFYLEGSRYRSWRARKKLHIPEAGEGWMIHG